MPLFGCASRSAPAATRAHRTALCKAAVTRLIMNFIPLPPGQRFGAHGAAQSLLTLPYPYGYSYDLALNGSGNGSASLTVYGQVLAGQPTAIPGTYTWTSAASPGMVYGYKSSAICPTGSYTASTSGTTWTATIASNCSVSATNLNFGTVGLLNSALNATNTLSVQCTNTTPYNVGLNASNGMGATVTSRTMTNGVATVSYSLYRDSAGTTNWGNTVEQTRFREPAIANPIPSMARYQRKRHRRPEPILIRSL